MPVSIGSITSADAVFTLTVPGLYSAPQQIQQFDVDDAFDTEAVENGEIMKGVDGYMAAGWKPTMPKLNVHLMANSPSNSVFDTVFQTEQQQKTKFLMQGIITLPGIGMQFTLLNGYLFSYMHIPPAKTTLKGRTHVLILDDIPYSPIGATS